jgi:hypothetical protein
MSTGKRIWRYAGIMVLCLGTLSSANAAEQRQKKSKKPQLPPLPSGPTGRPVPQFPLDTMAPVSPQVTYENGDLTIVAPNSTLGDILRAVRKQTRAEIEVPEARERVVTHLGPGPARDVIAELLNGSRFNYVLIGSADNPTTLTRIVLVAKTPPTGAGPNPAEQQQAALRPGGAAMQPPEQQDMSTDTNDADSTPEENAPEENADQPAAEADQPAPQGDQPAIKTPQQLLQEMQQRQLQMQQQLQQQPSGQPPQPPVPGPVQRPPQQEQQ